MTLHESLSIAVPTPAGKTRGHRVVAVISIGLFVLIVLLALDGIWAARGAERSLAGARDDLRAGADALIAGNPDEAAALFSAASADAARARQIRLHPAGALLRLVPRLGNNVSAVLAFSDAATLAADAGQILASAASKLGWNGTGVPGVSKGLGTTTTVLKRATPQLLQASQTLMQAETVLAGIGTRGLVDRVQEAVITARSTLTAQSSLLRSAVDVAQLLPGLLADGRRYLFIVQNPDEPRGTGGFMGYFGVLEARGGHLHLTKFFPSDGVLVPKPVTAPADFKARYARFNALHDLRQANFCPDLPTTAKVVLQMAAQRGWGEFDGIFLVDTVGLQDLLEATGPVDLPGSGQQLSAANVIQVLGHDVFLLAEKHSNELQGAIGRAVWDAVQTRSYSATALATALSRSVVERHLQIYSTHRSEEALVTRFGAAGATTLGKNPLAVVWVGISASKVAYFARRSVDQAVTLDTSGTATVTTTLHLMNTAPDAPASELLGDGTSYPVGTLGMLTSVYLPQKIHGYPEFKSSGPTVTGVEHEFGRPVGLGYLETPSGGRFAWSMTYTVPSAVTETNGVKEYRVDYLPQPMLSPMPISVTIELPAGATVSGTSPGVEVSGTTVTYADSPTTSQSIWVRFIMSPTT